MLLNEPTDCSAADFDAISVPGMRNVTGHTLTDSEVGLKPEIAHTG